MAVVQMPLMSMNASGKIGDMTFTTWKGMSVARANYIYTDPSTSAQLTSRALLTSCSQAWGSTLNQLERDTWNERAQTVRFITRFGEQYQPSGFQLFMKWNMQLLQIGESILKTAPKGGECAIVTEIKAVSTGNPGEMKVSLLKSGLTVPSCKAIVFFQAGPYDSGGRNPIAPEYRRAVVMKPASTYIATSLTALKYYWWKAFCVFESGIKTNDWEVQGYVPI